MTRPDGYWIGHPGALLPLPDVQGSLTRKSSREVSYAFSASGRRRAYLSARRAPLREWSVTLPRLRPPEAAALHGLLLGTEPPYVWVDPWSRVTNLLTPAAAALRVTTPASLPTTGRQPLEGGGFAPTGVANPGAGPVRVEPAPVVAGMPVTVSAYLGTTTTARVAALFLDTAGNQVSEVQSPTVPGGSVLRRAHITATAPPLAAAVSIRVTGATVVAQAAVTWTADLLPYGGGGGAAKVVVTGLDEAVQFAMLEPHGRRWADLSFTVTEVG